MSQFVRLAHLFPAGIHKRSGQYFVILLFIVLLAYVLLSGKYKRKKSSSGVEDGVRNVTVEEKLPTRTRPSTSATPSTPATASSTRSRKPPRSEEKEPTAAPTPESKSKNRNDSDDGKKSRKEHGSSTSKSSTSKTATTPATATSSVASTPTSSKSDDKIKSSTDSSKSTSGSKTTDPSTEPPPHRLPTTSIYHPDSPAPATPPPLKPLPPSAQRPIDKKKIFRKRSSDDILPPSANTSAKNRIHYVDEGDNPAPDIVTGHVRKNQNFLGNTPSDEAFPHRPEKVEVHHLKKKHVPAMIMEERFVDNFKTEIPEPLYKILKEAETIVQSQPGSELWPKAMREEWDKQHGVLPHFAKDVCGWIGKAIEDQLPKVHSVMQERAKSQGKQEAKRSFDEFLKDRISNTKPTGPELAIGWFCDWFRLVDNLQRMAFTDQPVNMMEKLGVTAKLLAWIEMFARLCVRQRLLSPSGIDLHGLILRVRVVEEKPEWRMDLTMFLPSDVERSKDKRGNSALRRWSSRAMQYTKAIRSLFAEMNTIFGENMFEIRRRRLILRPLCSISTINSKGGVDQSKDEFEIAQDIRFNRIAKTITVSERIFDKIDPTIYKSCRETLRKPLALLQPIEVLFHRQRQYHWHKQSSNPTSNDLSPIQFALAVKMIGQELQGGKEDDQGENPDVMTGTMNTPRNDYIECLDFGGLVPMMKESQDKDKDKEELKILRPKGFTSLKRFVLPYVPSNETAEMGATAEIIVSPKLGLYDQLLSTVKPITIYITLSSTQIGAFEEEMAKALKVHQTKSEVCKKLVDRVRVMVCDVEDAKLGDRIVGRRLNLPSF